MTPHTNHTHPTTHLNHTCTHHTTPSTQVTYTDGQRGHFDMLKLALYLKGQEALHATPGIVDLLSFLEAKQRMTPKLLQAMSCTSAQAVKAAIQAAEAAKRAAEEAEMAQNPPELSDFEKERCVRLSLYLQVQTLISPPPLHHMCECAYRLANIRRNQAYLNALGLSKPSAPLLTAGGGAALRRTGATAAAAEMEQDVDCASLYTWIHIFYGL